MIKNPVKLPSFSYESPTLAAWQMHSQDQWRAYTEHAFVAGLGDGSLPKAAFIDYLIQDYVFLVHFSRAWAMAIVKASSLQEMKLAAGTVNALVNHEMQLHVAICAGEGITEDQLFRAREEPANLAYTRYVMDAGLAGDFLDLLAALSPCVFGYGQIGLQLATRSPQANPYQRWIDTYACDEYQQVCQSVAQLLEQAVTLRLGESAQASPRWASLCDRFDTATRLEVGFWSMALQPSSSIAPHSSLSTRPA